MRLEEYTAPVSEDSSGDLFRLRFAFKTVARLSSLVQKRTASRTEAAGLLFGTAQPGLIDVSAFRSFALDLPYEAPLPLPQFREAARAALATSRFDPEVASLQPVGWYRLHLEQCSEMSEEELQLHNDIAPGALFTALFLQPSAAGLLSGIVFSGSAEDQPLTFANRRIGSLNISTASTGVESVEVTVRDAAQPPETATSESWQTAVLRRAAFYGDALKRSLNGYAWGLALVAALAGFLVGVTITQDGQAATGSPSVSASNPRSTAVSASSKNSAFDFAMKREGANIVITWNNGLDKPTLAYLTIVEHGAATNLNITASYRPNGLLLLPGHGGTVEASLALSDGLDTVERRASLRIDEKSVIEAGAGKDAPVALRNAGRTSDELSRLETRNRRLEALITVLEQRKEEKPHTAEDSSSKPQP